MAIKKAHPRPKFDVLKVQNLQEPAALLQWKLQITSQFSFQTWWLGDYVRFMEYRALFTENAILQIGLAPREIQIDIFLKGYKWFQPFENGFQSEKIPSFSACIPNFNILWRNFIHLCIYLSSYLTKWQVSLKSDEKEIFFYIKHI